MAEKMEIMEIPENDMPPETRNEVAKSFQQVSEEMKAVGNHDMAQYYAQKAQEFSAEATPEQSDIKLGGWYAGLTANEWRNKAKEEFVKNGNSLQYKRYCDNAIKANN